MLKNDRTWAFVPVRLSSTRFPEKHLRKIGDRSLLSWVMYHLRQAKTVDGIVICSSSCEENRILERYAEQNDVEVYFHEGDPDDVVGRLTFAAKKYEAEICILASGDYPLLPSETIDNFVTVLKSFPFAGRVVSAALDGKCFDHEGFFVARRSLWERADKESTSQALREHQFPILFMHPNKFQKHLLLEVYDNPIFYEERHRISIDTLQDLEFANRVHDSLTGEGLDYTLCNALTLLQEQPSLRLINQEVKQRRVFEKESKVVFFLSRKEKEAFVEKSSEVLHIAKNCTGKFGASVEFVLPDLSTSDLVRNNGFNSVVGDLKHMKSLYEMERFDALVVIGDRGMGRNLIEMQQMKEWPGLSLFCCSLQGTTVPLFLPSEWEMRDGAVSAKKERSAGRENVLFTFLKECSEERFPSTDSQKVT